MQAFILLIIYNAIKLVVYFRVFNDKIHQPRKVGVGMFLVSQEIRVLMLKLNLQACVASKSKGIIL